MVMTKAEKARMQDLQEELQVAKDGEVAARIVSDKLRTDNEGLSQTCSAFLEARVDAEAEANKQHEARLMLSNQLDEATAMNEANVRAYRKAEEVSAEEYAEHVAYLEGKRIPTGMSAAETRDACLVPFADDQIDKLPRYTCKACRDDFNKVCPKHKKQDCHVCKKWMTTAHMHLDYVGHAQVTARLLDIDPDWSWEPVAFTEEGLPLLVKREKLVIMWVRLTINGITRLGVGNADAWKDDADKIVVGDALRNAAMRFGVALDLWSKSDLKVEQADETPPEPRTERVKYEDSPPSEAETKAQEPAEAAEAPEEPEQPETAPVAPTAVEGVTKETFLMAFTSLKSEFASKSRHALDEAGLWPVVDLEGEKLEEAWAIVEPITWEQADKIGSKS